MRLLHLVGSPTAAAWDDLSRLYTRGALAAIGGTVAHVAPDGTWRFAASLDTLEGAPPMNVGEAVARIAAEPPDLMVPQLFCPAGMTAYRALFDVLGVPHVGNRPAAMALGADKAQARAVVAAAGVDVPAGTRIAPGAPADGIPDLPVVVKPVAADNSEGVTLVGTAEELPAALAAAHAHGDALVETYVPAGREVRCGTLERDGDLRVLPLEEYPVDADRPVRTAGDKLSGSGEDLRLVAKGDGRAWIVDPDDPVNRPVGEAASRAHRALGCRHYGLFDFRIDPDGRPWFLEAGLYCSFSPDSVLAAMAGAAGLTVNDLFDICAQEALR